MIGLAVLEWLARKVDGTLDNVGQKWFYEDMTTDATGELPQYGIYLTTQSAPRTNPLQSNHNFITVDVAVGEGAKGPDGGPIANKYETDRTIDAIRDAVDTFLAENNSTLTIAAPGASQGETFRNVRLYPSASKGRTMYLPNGAIVKEMQLEVYYE